jgi:hypothetical protein
MVRWDGAAEFWTESADKFVEFMQKLYASDKLVGMFCSPISIERANEDEGVC